jgi:mannose-6-phosphate isomerase-like protein (cupin superfamily)
MSASAYFVTTSRVLRVANDNGVPVANVHHLPPNMQTGVRRNRSGDLVLFVEEGVVEFMIGGASGYVTAGSFVRVPIDTPYSFRNAGDDTARIVSQSEAADSAA